MERSAKEQAAREQRQAEAEERRQQQEQERQIRINQQMQSAAARAQQDPALNPFASAPSSEGSSGGANAPAANPDDNYAGQACRWFVVRDEESCSSRTCYYIEGETVALGLRAYRCDSGRWTLIRDCNQSTSELRKKECQRDIVNAHGSPGSKETPAQKILSQD